MISTSAHLGRLVEIIEAIMEYNMSYSNGYGYDEDLIELHNSMKLFKYAGNLIETKYSPFTEAGMYCKGIHKEELLEQKSIEPYLFNISIFSIAWMGLESLINDRDIHNTKSNVGKIRALCNELDFYSSKIKIPREYKKCLSKWIELDYQLNHKYKGRKHIPKTIKLYSEGIYRVYSLRNHIVHGNFSYILPSDPLWKTYINFLDLGSRIIAFTVQMLLMGILSDQKNAITIWHGSLQEYSEYICIERAFKFLHLEWI